MQALFVASNPTQGLSDGLHPEIAAAKIRELLKLPNETAGEAAHWKQRAGANSSIPFPGGSPLHAVQRVASFKGMKAEEEFRPLTRAAAVGRPA